jgi:hypothetical protein
MQITALCDRLKNFAQSNAFAIASGSSYHSRPKGARLKLNRRRNDLCAGGLRKRALAASLASRRFKRARVKHRNTNEHRRLGFY